MFHILKDGAAALRGMGLDQAADQMLLNAEQALILCEDQLNHTLRYVLEEAKSAIEAHQRLEAGHSGPRRAARTMNLEQFTEDAMSPWYGQAYQDMEDTMTYLPDFVTSATVRNIDDARKLRRRKNFTVHGRLKKGIY